MSRSCFKQWVMVAVLAVAFTLGKVATLVLFGFASFFALREFITPVQMTECSGEQPLSLPRELATIIVA